MTGGSFATRSKATTKVRLLQSPLELRGRDVISLGVYISERWHQGLLTLFCLKAKKRPSFQKDLYTCQKIYIHFKKRKYV